MAFIGAATASAGPAPPLWRATQAPGDRVSLSEYVLQPPDGGPPVGDEGDDEGDSTLLEPSAPTTPETPFRGQQPGTQNQPPGFGVPDTGARTDSLFMVPLMQPAATETIGAIPSTLPVASGNKPVKSRRGVLGLHPAALIAGIVVLHVFVVGLATK